MDIKAFQRSVGDWHRHHFPNATATNIVLKAVEEVAELAAAHNHRIAGDSSPYASAKEMDAVADVIIVLAAFCDRGFAQLDEVLESVWNEVSHRSEERIHRNSTVADSMR